MVDVQRESVCQIRLARKIDRLASEVWGNNRRTVIVGRHESLADALERVSRFAASDSPVLITGETGTGKELFARALFLLSERRHKPFLSINCAQYHDGQLIASELFGHRRGSFTGAVADHRGMFDEANGGTIVLGEGEIVPVGGTQAKHVDVRVVTATSRDLMPMVERGAFRLDLYYRLRTLHVVVPPVRARGSDWELIAGFYLDQLRATRGFEKSLSPASRELMSAYSWPGNVRELRGVVDAGFHLSTGDAIEPAHFAEQLESSSRADQWSRIPLIADRPDPLQRMLDGEETFWDAVHRPYLRRELSRGEAREIIARGLERTRGSYKKLLPMFNLAADDYLKFMDFLRHQQLKPD